MRADRETIVHAKDLAELVESSAFRYRLGRAARITMQTGYETGFELLHDQDRDKTILTPVFTGMTDRLDPYEYTTYHDNPAAQGPWWANDTAWLLRLHFHTGPSGPLQISTHDALTLQNYDSRYHPPVIAVGTVSDSGSGEIVLLQHQCGGPLGDQVVELADEINKGLWEHRSDDCYDSNGFFDVFGSTMASAVRFERSGRWPYTDIHNVKNLTKFQNPLIFSQLKGQNRSLSGST